MVSRIEPTKFDSTSIHKDCLELLEKHQWTSFLEKFDGFNEKVSMKFACSFDGERATMGNLTIRLYEHNIVQVIGLSQ